MGHALKDGNNTLFGTGSSGFLHLETEEEARDARARARRARNRINAHRRDAFWTACAIVALSGAAVGGVVSAMLGQGSAGLNQPQAVRLTVTVAPGDTLWGLATKYGSPDANVEEEVDDIAAANRISSAVALSPGQKLTIAVTNPQILAATHPVRMMTVASAR